MRRREPLFTAEQLQTALEGRSAQQFPPIDPATREEILARLDQLDMQARMLRDYSLRRILKQH